MNKAYFCISIDTELLWGRHDLDYKNFTNRAQKVRGIIQKLLKIFESNQIPVTWAIIGHLFLDSCSAKNGIKHPEIKRPQFIWLKRDWFSSDPCSTTQKEPLWYGTDIISNIAKIKNQEIASHSFSHMIFGDKGCSTESADSELKTCVNLANKRHINLTSFVFPRNSVGHLKLLKKNGFNTFRGQDSYLLNIKPFFVGFIINKVIMLLDTILLKPHSNKIRLQNNLVNIPGSMYFMSIRGVRKYIPQQFRIIKAKRSIDRAIQRKEVFHLWFHPIDLADDPKTLISSLKQIIDYAKEKEKQNLLEIKNMQQISTAFLQHLGKNSI